ncbi:MAG: hypothetical protein ABI448_05270 [Bacteroidia bacterium]
MAKRKLPIRLILSVAAGIAISTVLSAITHEILHLVGFFPSPLKPMFDTGMVLIALVYHSVFAVIGAFYTAMIAKEKARKAVFFLGSKEAIIWLLGTILLWKHSPPWYNITKAIIGIPLALLGGKIYANYKLKKEKAAADALLRE